jgi:hypothetical protein
MSKDGRACFDRWDATRLCRGEYSPYPLVEPGTWTGIYVVEGSGWLRERFVYEARHYESSYNFGGMSARCSRSSSTTSSCSTMNSSRWWQVASGSSARPRPCSPTNSRPIIRSGPVRRSNGGSEGRGRNHLSAAARSEADRGGAGGLGAVRADAGGVALELEGEVTVDQWLGVRTRRGRTVSRWRSSFGHVVATFEGVPEDAAWLPLGRAYAAEVAARRSAMQHR